MVTRGLDTSTWDSSDFNRLNEFLPENIHSRYLTLHFKNEFEWLKQEEEIIIDNVDIHGEAGATYDPDGKGGVIVESGADPEQEESSFYTVDES